MIKYQYLHDSVLGFEFFLCSGLSPCNRVKDASGEGIVPEGLRES